MRALTFENMTECGGCDNWCLSSMLAESETVTLRMPDGWKHSNIGWLCPDCVRVVEAA